jgi:hypothetical protein
VCLAALQHDIGMAEWDLRPALNPNTGLPRSFLEMPLATHLELWTAAPRRVLSQSRYAALLVSMHGTALYGRRDLGGAPEDERALVTGYLEGQRALQARLIAQLDLDPHEVARNQRLIWTWDSLSLALCLPWPELTVKAVPSAAGPTEVELAMPDRDRFTLSPWPFAAGEVQLQCEGRRLEGRYASEDSLHAALERAPLVSLRVRVSERE